MYNLVAGKKQKRRGGGQFVRFERMGVGGKGCREVVVEVSAAMASVARHRMRVPDFDLCKIVLTESPLGQHPFQPRRFQARV